MKFQANKGHLQQGGLNLKPSTKAVKSGWRTRKRESHIKQLKPPALNWKGK